MKTRKTNSLFQLVGLAGLALLAVDPNALAATYNFYFNNSEQGDNSTATPTVVVKDGEDLEKQKAAEENKAAPESQQTPAQAPQLAPTLNSNQATITPEPTVPSRPAFRHLRIIGGTFTGDRNNYEYPQYSSYDPTAGKQWASHNIDGGMVSVAYFFSKYGGLNLFVGDIAGVEFEVVPIHWFSNVVEIGFLFGRSMPSRLNDAAFHGGWRLSINAGERWGITWATRGTIPDGNFSHTSGEFGVMFRL